VYGALSLHFVQTFVTVRHFTLQTLLFVKPYVHNTQIIITPSTQASLLVFYALQYYSVYVARYSMHSPGYFVTVYVAIYSMHSPGYFVTVCQFTLHFMLYVAPYVLRIYVILPTYIFSTTNTLVNNTLLMLQLSVSMISGKQNSNHNLHLVYIFASKY